MYSCQSGISSRAAAATRGGRSGRVRNITAAIAKVGPSSALAEQLQSEEEKLRSLRERAAASTESHGRALAAPDPKVVVRVLEGVLELAEKAPERARAALARVLVPITLKPVVGAPGERFYEAHGAINTNPAVLSGDRVHGSVNAGCGGGVWTKADLSSSPA